MEEVYVECARSYIDLVSSSTYSSIRVSLAGTPPLARGDGELDVYVKSIYELSIDEIPIIAAIVRALSHRRLNIYDYESIEKEKGRHVTAAMLLEKAIREGRSFLMVAPSALPLGLVRRLPKEYWDHLASIHVANVEVSYDNPLYLPQPPVEGTVSLVAKRNSEASYDRVEWLSRRAYELGLGWPDRVFLDSNKQIFDYVVGAGVRGLRRRVPVNKLAGHIVALDRCLGLGMTRLLWRRGERVTHLLYAWGVGEEELEGLKREVERFNGLRPVLTGVVYDYYRLGALRIQARLLQALGLSS